MSAPSAPPDILCIGSVLWDVIGRTPEPMAAGADVPGRITRLPGGVALNIAMALARCGMRPALLSAVGRDPEGDELIAAAQALGLDTAHVLRRADLPTDRYMAIEDAGGVVAAIADAHSLEACGAAILAPLSDGRLGSPARPWTGPVALDGNLTEDLLAEIARAPYLSRADLRIAPASPGKALRLRPLMDHPRATLYVNRTEAGLLTGRPHPDSRSAALAMIAAGARRVLVTDGGRDASAAVAGGATLTRPARRVSVVRVTGAGDTFMAAHVAAELRGLAPAAALAAAVGAAAAHVAGECP